MNIFDKKEMRRHVAKSSANSPSNMPNQSMDIKRAKKEKRTRFINRATTMNTKDWVLDEEEQEDEEAG